MCEWCDSKEAREFFGNGENARAYRLFEAGLDALIMSAKHDAEDSGARVEDVLIAMLQPGTPSFFGAVLGRLAQLPAGAVQPRPPIVVLCGSTRFWMQFQEASLAETLAGKIVLSVGAAVASDEEHFGHLPEAEKAAIKARLDELHLRKIDQADEVLILNLDGYIGESTRRELEYAISLRKPIRFLEPTNAPLLPGLVEVRAAGGLSDPAWEREWRRNGMFTDEELIYGPGRLGPDPVTVVDNTGGQPEPGAGDDTAR